MMFLLQRSVNTYYMVKLQVRSENLCLRPWAFERVPGKALRGFDNSIIYTSTKEACLASCLSEVISPLIWNYFHINSSVCRSLFVFRLFINLSDISIQFIFNGFELLWEIKEHDTGFIRNGGLSNEQLCKFMENRL